MRRIPRSGGDCKSMTQTNNLLVIMTGLELKLELDLKPQHYIDFTIIELCNLRSSTVERASAITPLTLGPPQKARSVEL